MGKNYKAFTMIELLVVMIVLGIIAAWGVPQYGRSLSRARARNAIQNLSIVHAANLLYIARNNRYCTGLGINATPNGANVCANTAAINSINGANSLNIVDGGLNYTCGVPALATTCTANTAGATVTVDLSIPLSAGNPSCADGGAGVCP